MYDIPELAGYRRQPPAECSSVPRLFFSIYYRVADNAFQYASDTWKSAVQTQEHFMGGHDYFFEREVRLENEFKTAWEEVDRMAQAGGYEVWIGNIFSHASKQTDNNDGLEFEGGTLTAGEISSMKKLPWSAYGYLVLTSCNSGLVGARSWTPASAFASRQGVPTLGQAGYAYFSKTWNKYDQKSPSDRNISLWAYRRGANGMFGNGERMQGIVFT